MYIQDLRLHQKLSQIRQSLCFIGAVFALTLSLTHAKANETVPLQQLEELKRLSKNQNKNNAPSFGHDLQIEKEDLVIREAAFEGMLKDINPLSPDQIQRLKQDYQNTHKAMAESPNTPPKPLATSQFVNLSPGATPPVVRFSNGFVTSMVFLDSSGMPWPVSSYSLGNTDSFEVHWNQKDHILVVKSKKLYAYGNMSVRLKGLSTPVMLMMVTEQKVFDSRIDFRVQGFGPNTGSMPTHDGLPQTEDDVLLGVLDGVPPQGAVQYYVDDSATQVWYAGSVMFVRTRHKILSPGWTSSMRSADGTYAYQMNDASSILISDNGKIRSLKIKKKQG